MHVVVEDAAGGLPVGGVGRRGQVGRVCAQQVVQRVPAGHVFDDQVGAGEFGQRRPHRSGRPSGEAGGRRDSEIRAGMTAEQPEQPGRIGSEGPVGPGEDGTHVGGGRVAGQRLPPVLGVA